MSVDNITKEDNKMNDVSKASKYKRVKSVAFNIQDPMELKLMQYAKKQGAFSTYIKRLIQRDLEGGEPKEVAIDWEQVARSLLDREK